MDFTLNNLGKYRLDVSVELLIQMYLQFERNSLIFPVNKQENHPPDVHSEIILLLNQ